MNLNELKSMWQNSDMAKKSPDELALLLTTAKNAASTKIRKRLLIESTLLAGLAFFYYDAFDGADKSLLVNLLLASSIALFVATDIISYVVLIRPIRSGTLRDSLQRFKSRLGAIMMLSVANSVLFAASLLLFFSENIAFSERKYYFLAGIIATFLGLFYLSYRVWIQRIRDVATTLKPWEDTGSSLSL